MNQTTTTTSPEYSMTDKLQTTINISGLLWQPMETAPKDGTEILVAFKRNGVKQVFWGSPEYSDNDPYIWCVDDNKHGPYALRGYNDGDELAWMPTPKPPEQV